MTEVYRLRRTVLKKMQQKKCLNPKLFMAFSNSDQVISAKTCEQFFRHYASTDSRCVIHHSGLNTNTDARIHYLNATFPETPPYVLRHNGLPISSENGFYGVNSNYRESKKDELLYNPQFDEQEKDKVEFLGENIETQLQFR